MTIKTTLPTDSAARKRYPMLRGALRYAPAAWAGMSRISINGNDKHNPGEELHHARGKSMDHGDCIVRHLTDSEDIQVEFERRAETPPSQAELDQLREEVDQLMWRTALYVQQVHEKYFGAPLAPGARLPAAEPKQGSVKVVCGDVALRGAAVCDKPPGHDNGHSDSKAGIGWPQAPHAAKQS